MQVQGFAEIYFDNFLIESDYTKDVQTGHFNKPNFSYFMQKRFDLSIW